MYYLSISDKCNECLKCEKHLPGVINYVKANTFMLVSDVNMYRNTLAISAAIDVCESNAIEFKDWDRSDD